MSKYQIKQEYLDKGKSYGFSSEDMHELVAVWYDRDLSTEIVEELLDMTFEILERNKE